MGQTRKGGSTAKLPAGAVVVGENRMTNASGMWCFVHAAGQVGWLPATALDTAAP